MRKIHDHGYKYLFSHAGFVEQLLESFVPLSFVKDLNFNRMEKINTSFIRKNLKNKESDVIWKIHYQNKEIYLYILLEFQSTVDHWMALRMLSYIIDFYEDIIKKGTRKETKNLPIIFPILIYNGEEKWTAKEEIQKLITTAEKEISPYIPHFKYFSVIINQFSKRSLYHLNNLISGIFMVESVRTAEEFQQDCQKIIELLKKELDPQLKEAFINWIEQLEAFGKRDIELPIKKIIQKEKEGVKMLNKVIDEIEERGLKKGLQQGMQQGMQHVAYKLFDLGLDPELIQKATGLSATEIETYKKRSKTKK